MKRSALALSEPSSARGRPRNQHLVVGTGRICLVRRSGRRFPRWRPVGGVLSPHSPAASVKKSTNRPRGGAARALGLLTASHHCRSGAPSPPAHSRPPSRSALYCTGTPATTALKAGAARARARPSCTRQRVGAGTTGTAVQPHHAARRRLPADLAVVAALGRGRRGRCRSCNGV